MFEMNMQCLKKRERCTEGGVERLGDSHKSRTNLGWGVAHGGIEEKIGERKWKSKFLDKEWLRK